MSRPATASYKWQIKRFSQQDTLTKLTNQSCLRSTGFPFKLLLQDGTTAETNGLLWLSRDRIKSDENEDVHLSPWLRLTLTTSYHSQYNNLPDSLRRHFDTRNICFAWIYARRRECISRLMGGFHGSRGMDFIVSKPEFVLYDDLVDRDKNLLFQDTLTICCTVHAFDHNEFVDSWLIHPSKTVFVHNAEHTLKQDLRRMLEMGQGSDVSLVASDGREFAAHMAILSSRTPFFAKMFEHKMQEQQEKRVTIKDLDSNSVEGLLEFIYTDEVSNIILK